MRIVLKWDGKDFEGWTGFDWVQRWWEVVGLFGWQGRFETCPYVSGALAWIGGMWGLVVVGVRGGGRGGCLAWPRSAPG